MGGESGLPRLLASDEIREAQALGILEDLGMDLLPRRDFRQYAEGYLARDPRLVVVDEKIFTYLYFFFRFLC